ncbi:hypothetical protein SCLCIDRAFT_133132, partial [Scleroderma citrinum Foug A]
LTDELLTLVESNTKWMVAFGFDKSSTSGGLTIIECCTQITCALFIMDKPDALFEPADLKKLTEADKNRISSLCTTYNEYRKQLGETGHGVVVSDCEHEITPGSEITNIYGISCECVLDDPYKMFWYQRMHELAGTSPVASRVAVTNSTSSLDLTILNQENEGDVQDEDEDIEEVCCHSLLDLSDYSYGHPCSQGEAWFECPASPSIGQSSVKKKKTPQELAHELVEGEHAARLQMTLYTSKEKTKRELIKREAACNTALEIERLHLKHQQKEADCQQAHELMMMDRQIKLEQL